MSTLLQVKAGLSHSQVVVMLLLGLSMVSALGVIYSSYKSRQLFAELQRLQRQTVELEEDWGRLLLERSTWAAPDRVQQIATSRLGMQVPQPADTVMVYQ